MHQYSAVIRGYDNYYSFVKNRGRFAAYLYYVIKDSCARTIAKKMSLLTRAAVYKKYSLRIVVKYYKKAEQAQANLDRIIPRTLHPSARAMAAWETRTSVAVACGYDHRRCLARLDQDGQRAAGTLEALKS